MWLWAVVHMKMASEVRTYTRVHNRVLRTRFIRTASQYVGRMTRTSTVQFMRDLAIHNTSAAPKNSMCFLLLPEPSIDHRHKQKEARASLI